MTHSNKQTKIGVGTCSLRRNLSPYRDVDGANGSFHADDRVQLSMAIYGRYLPKCAVGRDGTSFLRDNNSIESCSRWGSVEQ